MTREWMPAVEVQSAGAQSSFAVDDQLGSEPERLARRCDTNSG